MFKGGHEMRVFRNISIMTKVLLLAIIMIILQMLIFFMGYRTSQTIRSNAESMYEDYASPAIWVLNAKSIALQNRRLVFRALDAGSDWVAMLRGQVAGNMEQMTELLDRYADTLYFDDEKALYAKLSQSLEQTRLKHEEILSAAESGDPGRIEETSARFSLQGDVTLTENEFISDFDNMADLLVRMADEANGSSAAEATRHTARTVAVSVAAVLTGLVLSFVIARTITVPVRETERNISLLSRGDLRREFETSGRDEIASMARSLQEMADNLKQIIGSVKGASGHISDTAQGFSSLAEETKASVEEFRSEVENIGQNLNSLASTGEQVNASVQEVAVGAHATAERGTDIARKVDDAMAAGQNGMSAVQRAVSGIDGLAENAVEAAKSVSELGERSRQIQGFVSQIGDIAEQTNLLALNAAIEAARAGEAGRGFAVVAEEVRKLAENSRMSAKSIEELAEMITSDLDRVVAISRDNARSSEEAKELSRETENIIESMISSLHDIAGATQDLAAVSQEQAASSGEIAEAVHDIASKVGLTAEAGNNIRSGVGELSASAERIALGAQGLFSLASDMHEILKFFKLDEPSPASAGNRANLALKG
jgi:methyl-accepting chemotaxis protein